MTLPMHREGLNFAIRNQLSIKDCAFPFLDFTLSIHCFASSRKGLGMYEFPRSAAGSVMRLTGVVELKTLIEIVGMADVEASG